MIRVRVIDMESTGPSPEGDEHGLVEIAYTDLVARGEDLAGLPVDWCVVEGKASLVHPGVPIPSESSAIRAGPDSYATAHTLATMLNSGAPLEQLVEWTKLPALTVRCYLNSRTIDYRNGGKGTPWSEVDAGFLDWIVNKADFSDKPDILYTAKYHLEKREMDQRLESERRDLDAQLRANGLPVGPIGVQTMGEQGASTIPGAPPADPNQGNLAL